MTRHEDLLTRAEAAALLGVSHRLMVDGYGPAPLPLPKRPRYYSRRDCEQFIDELRRLAKEGTCSIDAKDRRSGGSSSSTAASATVSQRVRQLESKRRSRRGGSASKSSKRPALVAVPGE